MRLVPLAIALVLAACAGSNAVRLVPGKAAPLAEGHVDAWRVDGGQTRLLVQVKRLSEPGALVPGATAWVVWVQGLKADHKPANVGVLRLDAEGGGLLETLTPLADFGLFVTAEASGTATAPRGEAALSTQVHAK
ncbi:MAG: hypothetical protein FJ087_04020 [Deltaproteobacteria bacterium]|nr:hypothetical protein [Deltaproteobacteria bacterium]